jgi:L-alanine-DL-glutamate epimerase-like enolase superfamily enzyme
MIQETKELLAQGCTVFKIKVGSRNIPLDVKNVQDVRAILGTAGRLRLDANRSWSIKEAVLFALLANETIMDAGATKVRRLGDSPWVTMGKISLPF